jgi:two-component system response regulator AtoC
MQEVLRTVDRLTDSSYSLFVYGESGTGKELIARLIHSNGPRSKGPFHSVNCASIPANLIETELFGHTKGAFTGADHAKLGIFELCDTGVIFLDEIADAPWELQAKLLRVLQSGEIQRVGSEEVRIVDVRVISASNRDLASEIEAGRFREDLFYRLNVHRVELPPLRERPEDIPLLLKHFEKLHAKKVGARKLKLQRATNAALMAHSWPGNVRELENCVIDLLVRLGDGPEIRPEDLPDKIRQPARVSLKTGVPLKKQVEQTEKRLIQEALARCAGNRAKAAQLLDTSERNLYKKLQKYELRAEGRSA